VFTVGFMTDPKHYDRATWKKIGGNQSAGNVWDAAMKKKTVIDGESAGECSMDLSLVISILTSYLGKLHRGSMLTEV
jgi:hypothetical protein